MNFMKDITILHTKLLQTCKNSFRNYNAPLFKHFKTIVIPWIIIIRESLTLYIVNEPNKPLIDPRGIRIQHGK